ncbi:hypothetical protein DFH06DRAFT_1129605 [Mycena polygramma]|nr:hypothetical protein DFH06DRAFT_1129605 [Mycena polygramma]
MTTHSRSAPSAAPATAMVPFAMPVFCMMGVAFIPSPMGGMFALPETMAPFAAAAAPAPAAAAPAPAPKAAPSAAPAAAPVVPAAAPAPRNPGAGLPAPLVALLRGEEGPFRANEVFSVTPSEPLTAIEEEVAAPEWYAITRGRFVGVVDQLSVLPLSLVPYSDFISFVLSALSAVAISGVAHGARKAYTTQGLALDAFNRALEWGGVQVA